jgi:hypothetical protein
VGEQAKRKKNDEEFGAVEWIRTTTVLLPSAPQADASASSATTAQENGTKEFIRS